MSGDSTLDIDDSGRRTGALALAGLSLLLIEWAVYSMFVLGFPLSRVLFPLLVGVAHIGIAVYLLKDTGGSTADKVEDTIDDDFEP